MEKPSRRRRRWLFLALLAEPLALWLRVGRPGGRLVVRCRQGHLFTTLWVPDASVKSLRLLLWRVQRCPVGRHWTVVTPVRDSQLTPLERRRARRRRDSRLP